jgi:hypothetical protein
MDEFQVTVLAPTGLPATAAAAIRRALDRPAFRAALRRAAREATRRFPALARARVVVTR